MVIEARCEWLDVASLTLKTEQIFVANLNTKGLIFTNYCNQLYSLIIVNQFLSL